MESTVSLLTIAYNSASVLPQFFQCVLDQSAPPDELVLVDDGSTDGTAEALQEGRLILEQSGIRCRFVTHNQNLGRGAARQSGLMAAQGTFVSWADVDDLIRADRLASLRKALASNVAIAEGSALLSSPFLRVQAASLRRQTEVPALEIRDVRELYATGPNVQLQALSGHREAFLKVGFDPDLNWAEDIDFMIRFLESGGVVAAEPDGDPGRIIYFQSFRLTPREVVAAGNERLLQKNSAALRAAGIDPEAELAAKRKRYIDKFQIHSTTWGAPASFDGERPAILPTSVPLHDVVEWIGPDGAIIKRCDSMSQITPQCLPRSLLAGARGLHLRHTLAGSRVVQAYDLIRQRDAVIALGTHVQRLHLRADTAATVNEDNAVNQVDSIAPHSEEEAVAGGGEQTPLDPQQCPTPRFTPRFARNSGDCSRAIVISFFFGAKFYHDCAARLAEQLARQNVDFEICELHAPGNMEWINVCRQKIAFYSHMRRRHGRPLMWVDVDSQVIGDLSWHLQVDADLGAFLRNFKYLINFDPENYTRLLHPGYLRFGGRPIVDRFIEHLVEVDRQSPPSATDDYVLQEGLLTFEEQLSFLLFPSSHIVSTNEAEGRKSAVFQHTDSGNVSAAAAVAAQHEQSAVSVSRQVRVLREAASDAIRRNLKLEASVFLRRIRQLDPNNTEALGTLLRLYLRTGETGKYNYHFETAIKNPETRPTALRIEIDRRYKRRQFHQAHKREAELEVIGNDADAAFVASRRYRHSFDERAVAAGIDDASRTPMMWWEQPHPGNLGDIIGPYIVERLTGIPPRFEQSSPRLLSVGSIIKFARAGDAVWGSGASAISQSINPGASYRAVRGPITRAMVLDAGCECPEIYGDPAWFLPLIFDGSRISKTHRLGIIRHFTHMSRPIEAAPDVLDISIIRSSKEDIEDFLTQLNSCESIVSTSLHGLIIANAYGIPACLATDSASARQIHGDGTKFEDYALSIGVPNFTPLDLSSFDRITAELAHHCEHNPEKPIDLVSLADAAPFSLLPEFRSRLRQRR